MDLFFEAALINFVLLCLGGLGVWIWIFGRRKVERIAGVFLTVAALCALFFFLKGVFFYFLL